MWRKPSLCKQHEQAPHRCHPGPCPSCDHPCGKKMPCGHLCAAPCHSAVPRWMPSSPSSPSSPGVPGSQSAPVRVGPWMPQPEALLTHLDTPCPPCCALVTVACFGLHEVSFLLLAHFLIYSHSFTILSGLSLGHLTWVYIIRYCRKTQISSERRNPILETGKIEERWQS